MMPARSYDLASLLHPVSTAEFFARHWDREPLFVQGRGHSYYEELLTDRQVEELISNPDARYPAIRLAKDGWYFPPEIFTTNVPIGPCVFQGVPDLDKIASEYGKGATITMSALHRTCEPLRTLCTRLDEQIDHSAEANLYVTPGRAAGFPPHYDTHDVLILQIAGKKRWRIDAPTITLPLTSQEFRPEGFRSGRRLMELELQAGDLLYLPRGFVHSTTTSDSHSIHITIGVHIYTWAELVGDFVPGCVQIEEFRRALPAGFASRTELRPALKEQLLRLVPALSTGFDLDRLFDQLARLTTAGRRPPARFRADVVVLSADSLLEAPATRSYRVFVRNDQVTLEFDGRRFVFPAPTAAILSAMGTRPVFRVTDLPLGGNMEGVLGFARYLQSIGFLRVAG